MDITCVNTETDKMMPKLRCVGMSNLKTEFDGSYRYCQSFLGGLK